MLFAIYCLDKSVGGLEVRKVTRPSHLDHVREHAANVVMAGPLLDDEGKPKGSLFIVDFPDAAAARAFSDADPYVKAGLFERVSIHPFTKVFPEQ